MSSLAVVNVFYQDQDSTWMQPCRMVSRIEARRLKQCGAGSFIDHGRAFRLKEPTPPLPIALLPGLLKAAATITLAEIEANVGITEGGEPGTPANANLVRRAQFKIAAYPHIFDDLAVTARGSWLRSTVRIAVAG
jgi:hypothetical protein